MYSLGIVSIVQAGGYGYGSFNLPSPIGCEDFGCVAEKIAIALSYLAVPILTVMVLVGGYQIMFSAGNPEKLKAGKRTILYAAIGFLVVLIAQSARLIIMSIFT